MQKNNQTGKLRLSKKTVSKFSNGSAAKAFTSTGHVETSNWPTCKHRK